MGIREVLALVHFGQEVGEGAVMTIARASLGPSKTLAFRAMRAAENSAAPQDFRIRDSP